MSYEFVSLVADEYAYHNRLIAEFIQAHGNIVVPATQAKQNEITTANKPLRALAAQLNNLLSFFISVEHRNIEGGALMSETQEVQILLSQLQAVHLNPEELKPNYYISLLNRISQAATLTFIMLDIIQNQPEQSAVKKDPKYTQYLLYFAALNALLNYNQAFTLSRLENTEADIKKLIDVYTSSLFLYEQEIEPEHAIPEVKSIVHRVKKNARVLEHAMLDRLNYHWMDPEQCQFHLDYKNQRAQKFGGDFNGVIIRNAAATNQCHLDETAFIQLLKFIAQQRQRNQASRYHVVFYFNHEMGPVTGFDISFDPSTRLTTIVNLYARNELQQSGLIRVLSRNLSTHNFHHQLVACQADLAPTRYAEIYHIYALLGLSARFAPEQLVALATATQPSFVYPLTQTIRTLEPLANIKWLPLIALGEKALLLAPTLTRFREYLASTPAKQAEHLQFYQRKYGALPLMPTLISKLSERYKKVKSTDSVQSICTQLNAQSPADALRLAAAGHASRAHFDVLLQQRDLLNTQDDEPSKGWTPLMCALNAGLASRAEALLKAGANSGIVARDKSTAKLLFNSAKDDSPLKRHRTLRAHFAK